MGVGSGHSGAGSSGYQRLAPDCGEQTRLPLIPCPECGAEVLELVCGARSKVPGAVFFKCVHHDRDVPGTCPWILFEDKYRRYLISKGLISGKREGGKEQQVVQHDEEGGLQREEEELEALKIGIGGLDANLKKLVSFGQIVVVCYVVIAVCVVVGVISMLLK